jgi:hypothetical protein
MPDVQVKEPSATGASFGLKTALLRIPYLSQLPSVK